MADREHYDISTEEEPEYVSEAEQAGNSGAAALTGESEVIAPEDAYEGSPDADGSADVDSAGPEAVTADVAAPAADETKNWYIIHTYSGFERKVRESLTSRAEAFGFADKVGQILIPEEDVIENRAGKKIISKRLLYPGYVLVQLDMSDELWHAVKNTPRVTGFVGGGTKPVPLTADEVNSILYRQATAAERPRPKVTFEKGETVRITEGPFTNFSGKVDEINTERTTLRVLVTIFGRATPVELEFTQVEKT
ncbi:MAG TPA: transcription termination/antitermination protein NusG [Bryobacteraceae bacterium]|nr:transcription termination/antitermination protein NusG [Bryobacteraceae bacterium]